MLIETESRTGTLVRAINDLLIESGPAGLTIRNISYVSGVSSSSIYSQMGSREHLLRVAAAKTGRARTDSLRCELGTDGVPAFVPRHEEEIREARAWLGWLEMWRSEPFLGRWIADSRNCERNLLARAVGHPLEAVELDFLLALVEGLRVAVCAPFEPMPPGLAREILTSRCHTYRPARVLPCEPRSER